MDNYKYPAWFIAEEGGFVVMFSDLPEAITQGDCIEEALEAATDCLEEAISGRINEKITIPKASQPQPGQYMISAPFQTALKTAYEGDHAGSI